MPRAKYERTLQATSNGNVVVLSEGTAEFRTPGGDLIPLFDARENGTALGNPVTADSSGRVKVYFEPQRFRVRQRSSDSTIDETIVDEVVLADGVPAVGTSPGNLVALEDDGDGNGALPAVDGSNLLNVEGVPTGAEITWTGDEPPDGFLEEDGATLNRSEYPELWAHAQSSGMLDSEGSKDPGRFGDGDGSTTFSLPDVRGEFIRAWDDGRGVDSGRGLGSGQLDQMQRIIGSVGENGATFMGRFTSGSDWDGAFSSTSIQSSGRAATSDSSIDTLRFDSADSPNARASSSTDGETRARNVARMICIKY